MVKTIKVSEDTHAALVEIGKKSETFDELLQRLLRAYKGEADTT